MTRNVPGRPRARIPGAVDSGVLQAIFDPNSIPGLILWASADVGTYTDAGITPAANDDPVEQWNDRSPNINNFSQGILFSKPLLKTGILNGQPVLRFDGVGVGDFFDIAGFSGGSISTPNTVFIVMDFIAGTFIFDNVAGGAGRTIFGYAVCVGGQFSITADGCANSVSYPVTPPTGFKLFETVFDGGSSEIRENGLVVASGNAGTNTWDSIRLGRGSQASPSSQVDIAEILVYNAALNNSERQSIETLLISKYAL